MSPSRIGPARTTTPTYDWHGLYGVALDQLRDVIVPRIEDGFAVQRTKGLARLIRYLEAVDRHGRTYARAELADLESILGTLWRGSAGGGANSRSASATGPSPKPTRCASSAAGSGGTRSCSGRRRARMAGRHYDPLTRFERAQT